MKYFFRSLFIVRFRLLVFQTTVDKILLKNKTKSFIIGMLVRMENLTCILLDVTINFRSSGLTTDKLLAEFEN